jgi:hypothetical protein
VERWYFRKPLHLVDYLQQSTLKYDVTPLNDATYYLLKGDIEIRKHALFTVGKSKDKYNYLNDFVRCLEDDEATVAQTDADAVLRTEKLPRMNIPG